MDSYSDNSLCAIRIKQTESGGKGELGDKRKFSGVGERWFSHEKGIFNIILEQKKSEGDYFSKRTINNVTYCGTNFIYLSVVLNVFNFFCSLY